MSIPIECPECGFQTRAKESFIGRTVPCKRCGGPIHILDPKEDFEEYEESPDEPEVLVAEPEAVDDDEPLDGFVRIPCPSCGSEYDIAEEELGMTAECEDCGERFELRTGPPKKPARLAARKPPPRPAAGKSSQKPRAAGKTSGAGSRRASSRQPPPAPNRLPLLIVLAVAACLAGAGAFYFLFVHESEREKAAKDFEQVMVETARRHGYSPSKRERREYREMGRRSYDDLNR
jgi:hypothetical protein